MTASKKKPNYLVLFFHFLFIPIAISQNRAALDSLWTLYHTSEEDTSKIELLGELGDRYTYFNLDSAKLLSKQSLEMAKEIGSKKGIAKSQCNFGKIALMRDKLQISEDYFKKSLTIYKELNNNIGASKCLLYLGIKSYVQGKYFIALNHHLTGLDLLESEENDRLKDILLNSIGQTYRVQKNYPLALDYYKKGIALARTNNNKKNEGTGFLGVGIIFLEQDSLDKALNHFKKGEKIYEELGNIYELSYASNNIGEVYIKQKKYDMALEQFQKSLKINTENNDLHGKAINLINIGKAYFHLGKYSNAQITLEEAIQISQDKTFLLETNKAALLLKQVYNAQQRYQKALLYGNIYQTTNDSLFSIETKKTIEQFRFESETKEKEKENEALAQKNKIQELQIKNNRYSLLFMAIGIIITLLLALLLYFQQQNAKKTAMQEKAYSHKLEKVNKLRTNLFANIAHDFRTPLSLLVTPLQEMKEGRFQNNYQHYYSLMLTNARQLMTLVEQMLDLAKLDEGKMKLNRTKNDITLFARNHLMQFESMASHKNIELQLRCPKSPIEITFDRDKMSKIWNNLIDNVLKFTPKGGRVSLELSYQTTCWTLSVKDNGKGMSAKELTSIFTRYYRGYQGGTGTTGGLGLALVKQLTELHQGQIKVSSTLNQGSTFILTFPYLGDAALPSSKDKQIVLYNFIREQGAIKDSRVAKTKSPILISASLLNQDNPKLLIIEDNKDLNQLITDQLSADYHILRAFNGQQGLKKAISFFPDLILTDLMMPTMDGFDFVKKLNQSDANHLPVIIISALDKEVNDYQLWKEGIMDFISKPINFTELKYKLHNIISNKKRFQQKLLSKLPSLIIDPTDSSVLNMDRKLFKRFHHLVLEQLSNNDLNVDDLAKQLFISRRLFHQKIKAITGLPPASYIRIVRIKKGKELIKKREGNIQEIALEVGIPNPSHFTKLFKQEYGLSPKQFIKRLDNF